MRWMLVVAAVGASAVARADASSDVLTVVRETLGRPRKVLTKRLGKPETSQGYTDIFAVPNAKLHVSYVDDRAERVEILNAGTALSFPEGEPLVVGKRKFAKENDAGHVAYSSDLWSRFLYCERQEGQIQLDEGIREALATSAQRDMRSSNLAVRVDALGPNKRTIRVTYILCSETFMLRLENSGLVATWRKAGFERIECTDRYGESWSQGAKPKPWKKCVYRGTH